MPVALTTLADGRMILRAETAISGAVDARFPTTASLQWSKEYLGKLLLVIAGTGAGQTRRIVGVNQYSNGAGIIVPTTGDVVIDATWGTSLATNSVLVVIDDGTPPLSDMESQRTLQGTTYQTADFLNRSARGVLFHVSLSAKAGANGTTFTPSLQYKGPGSGTYVTIWTAAAALAAKGEYLYLLHPLGSQSGAGAYAGQFKEIIVGQLWRGTWRLVMTAGGVAGDTFTIDLEVSYVK